MIAPMTIIDAVHRAQRTVRAGAELAVILFWPGVAQLAIALVRSQRGGA